MKHCSTCCCVMVEPTDALSIAASASHFIGDKTGGELTIDWTVSTRDEWDRERPLTIQRLRSRWTPWVTEEAG